MITQERIARVLQDKGLKLKKRSDGLYFTRPAGKRHNRYRLVRLLQQDLWILQRDRGKFTSHTKEVYIPDWRTMGETIRSEEDLLTRISRRVYGGTPPW